MKKYKVHAKHEKGYDLQMEEFYLAEKVLQEFREQFEVAYPTKWIEKDENGNYRLEDDIKLIIEEYKEPEFMNSIPSFEISVLDEGHENTFLSIEFN